MPRKKSYLTVTDQFCGAGGSSQGAYQLGLEISVALNHWPLAIESHNSNFPDTDHDCIDVSQVDPRRYPSTDILITSPECTAHTYSAGKTRPSKQMALLEDDRPDPAEERSRMTMMDVPRFAEHHRYRIIVVENVVEVVDWYRFDEWLARMHRLGYKHHIIYFNSMFAHLRPLDNPQQGDFAPQSRDRCYIVFWQRGIPDPDLEFRPLAWCPECDRDVEAVQTWRNTKAVKKHGGRWGRYGKNRQYVYTCPHCSIPRKWTIVHPYYYAAANAVDWSLPVLRIGDREKPLKPKTIRRIYKGMEMFAGQQLLIDLSRSHGHDRRSVPLMRAAMQTQTSAQTAALLMLPFSVETLFTSGERRPKGVDEPMTTQTSRQSTAVVMPPLLTSVNYFDNIVRPADEPLPTQTTGAKLGVTLPPFLTVNYSPGYSKGVDEGMATVTTQDHHGLVVPPFLLGYANQEGPAKGVDAPLRTFHTGNGQALVMPPYLTYLRGTNTPKSVDEAMDTVAASGNHHGLTIPPFMVSYYGSNGNHRAVDREMGTVVSVDRHALVQPSGEISIEDCGFRMFEPHEIGFGMAFGQGYIVLGNKRQKVIQYGNAVTPVVMKMILKRCVAVLV